jgi:hypothetical protein
MQKSVTAAVKDPEIQTAKAGDWKQKSPGSMLPGLVCICG